jgi:hypothetical protein
MRKQKKYHFIYKTTNLLSGKYYIGMHSTDSLEDGYLGSGRRLRYSINKYGKQNHKREIIEFCKSRKELKSREIEIVNLNEIAKKDCINIRVGGGSEGNGHFHGGYKLSDETREKMSKTRKGIVQYEMTDEIRKKISNTLKKNYQNGYIPNMTGCHTKESRKKISDSNKGRIPWNKGKPNKQVTCPHCKKTGGAGAMHLHHFDKCKTK